MNRFSANADEVFLDGFSGRYTALKALLLGLDNDGLPFFGAEAIPQLHILGGREHRRAEFDFGNIYSRIAHGFNLSWFPKKSRHGPIPIVDIIRNFG